MANVTNPEVVAWVNKRIRVIADMKAQLFEMSRAISLEFTNRPLLSAELQNSSDVMIEDGAFNGDGRPIIHAYDCRQIIAMAQADVAAADATSAAQLKQLYRVSPNPSRLGVM